MMNKLKIILLGASLTLLMSACGGGGGGGSNPPPVYTTVTVKLTTTDALAPRVVGIAGLQTRLLYPQDKGLSLTEADVIASGKASTATPSAVLNAGEVNIGVLKIDGTTFDVGEFATINFTVQPATAVCPTSNLFSIDANPAVTIVSDINFVDISGISVAVQSVTCH